MVHLGEVSVVQAWSMDRGADAWLLVRASGEADSAGWLDPRLSPRFYATPPADGVWEFDLVGEPPHGRVPALPRSVSAERLLGCPPWLQGVRVYAAAGSLVSAVLPMGPLAMVDASTALRPPCRSGVQVAHLLAQFDEPVALPEDARRTAAGLRRRHRLTVTLDGPLLADIHHALAEAALPAAVLRDCYRADSDARDFFDATAALLATLRQHLGTAYRVHLDDGLQLVDTGPEWSTATAGGIP